MRKNNYIFLAMLILFFMASVAMAGGGYVTYTGHDGVRYYGDSVPPNPPSNVRVETRQFPASNQNVVGSEHVIRRSERIHQEKMNQIRQQRMIGPYYDAPAAKAQKNSQDIPPVSSDYQRFEEWSVWQSRKPTRPETGPVFRRFNAGTNAWQRYQDDLSDWRAEARELRKKYNEPNGFKTWR